MLFLDCELIYSLFCTTTTEPKWQMNQSPRPKWLLSGILEDLQVQAQLAVRIHLIS